MCQEPQILERHTQDPIDDVRRHWQRKVLHQINGFFTSLLHHSFKKVINCLLDMWTHAIHTFLAEDCRDHTSLFAVVRRIHVHESWLVFGSFLTASSHLWEARTVTFLRKAVIGQNLGDVLMFHDQEWVAAIPEFDLGDGVGLPELGVLDCWLDVSRPCEREVRVCRSGSRHACSKDE